MNRVQNYWTQRAHDFGSVRRNELADGMSRRWLAEFDRLLPHGRALDILDVGTGTGYFAVLLAECGHRICGIDLTPAMLDEARALAEEEGLDIPFEEMDAQALDFPDDCFDVVVSRNLTWTLPDPRQAYSEWYRVLRPGGLLLNFDANYGEQLRKQNRENTHVPSDSPYGHVGVTEELEKENMAITLSMPISREHRPMWDWAVLKELGFSAVDCDTGLGKRVLRELDVSVSPMFLVQAVK